MDLSILLYDSDLSRSPHGPYSIYRYPTYSPNIETLRGFQQKSKSEGVTYFFYPKDQMLLKIPTPSVKAAKNPVEEFQVDGETFLLYPKDQISDEVAKDSIGEIESHGKPALIFLKDQVPQLNIPTFSSSSSTSNEADIDSFIDIVDIEGESFVVYSKDQFPTSSNETTTMDSVGGYVDVEIDGEPYLVYYSPKYQVPSSSNEVALDSGYALPPQHFFLCPSARVLSIRNDIYSEVVSTFTPSTFFHPTCLPKNKKRTYGRYNHHPLPLFWCNNKIADECTACKVRELGTDYYLCLKCGDMHHKGCVESPLQINHPSHPEHALQLNFLQRDGFRLPCVRCGEHVRGFIYSCTICDIVMHAVCAQKTIPFYIDRRRRHHHTLTLFLRQSSLACNICGLINPFYLTYVCARCNFVAHSDCIYVPQVIRISRHQHRLSFTSSLQRRKWICGVCRREVDNRYGAFTCSTCTTSDYAFHTRCALRRDIWDGRDLEEIPEEEDEYKDVEPYQKIDEGIILHFSHHHQLFLLDVGNIYDEKKFCQACVLPIYEGLIYSCGKCDYILHETCAEARRKMLHALHPHSLQLDPILVDELFECNACPRTSFGFAYKCYNQGCDFELDVRCALTSEPFDYQGHPEHPLFLSLDPKEKPSCQVCKSTYCKKVLNCIECKFIICYKCATLPYMARYKHDNHYLKFCIGEEASDLDWCEVCEKKLKVGGGEGFYTCKDCCTTLHIHCLFGREPYMKVGRSFAPLVDEDKEFHFHHNKSSTRPFCKQCHIRCPDPIVVAYDDFKFCTYECAGKYVGHLVSMSFQ